jgi:DNA-binding transcriptional MerR regulator
MEQSAYMTVNGVAQLVGCHRETVLNYEKRGFLKAFRDHNGYRRFTKQEAEKLRLLIEFRKPGKNEVEA